MRTYEFDLKNGIDTDVKEVENTNGFLGTIGIRASKYSTRIEELV